MNFSESGYKKANKFIGQLILFWNLNCGKQWNFNERSIYFFLINFKLQFVPNFVFMVKMHTLLTSCLLTFNLCKVICRRNSERYQYYTIFCLFLSSSFFSSYGFSLSFSLSCHTAVCCFSSDSARSPFRKVNVNI